MKARFYFKKRSRLKSVVKMVQLFTITTLLMFSSRLMGQNGLPVEDKVDYLLRIYFSGENKDGLLKSIYVTIQELEARDPTPALVEQYTYLVEIEGKSSIADNACEVLDLLSVGIYNMDAAEAARHDVLLPTDDAREKSVDALASLTSINNSAKSTGSTVSKLAWNSYLLNSGRSKTLNKVAGVSNTVGDVAVAAGQAGQTVGEIGAIGKAIFGGKDRPCKNVPKKDIQIGEHHVQDDPIATTTATIEENGTDGGDTSTTTITISDLSFSSFRTLTDTLADKTDVHHVDKAYSESLSTITVSHLGSTDALADWIYDKFSHMLNLVAFESGKINLSSNGK